MMKRLCLAIALASGAVIPGTMLHADLNVDSKGFVTLHLGEEKWEDYPGISGIKRMAVYGNPSKPGPYVIRVKFSPGTMSMPHYHPEDRIRHGAQGNLVDWKGPGVLTGQYRTDSSRRLHDASGQGSAF
ncbi:MAG: hypothetical protein EXR36_07385 [Betaproteobacteria bacterium]|nr:hypothetical protein [Betaproteobacteria bacterium]